MCSELAFVLRNERKCLWESAALEMQSEYNHCLIAVIEDYQLGATRNLMTIILSELLRQEENSIKIIFLKRELNERILIIKSEEQFQRKCEIIYNGIPQLADLEISAYTSRFEVLFEWWIEFENIQRLETTDQTSNVVLYIITPLKCFHENQYQSRAMLKAAQTDCYNTIYNKHFINLERCHRSSINSESISIGVLLCCGQRLAKQTLATNEYVKRIQLGSNTMSQLLLNSAIIQGIGKCIQREFNCLAVMELCDFENICRSEIEDSRLAVMESLIKFSTLQYDCWKGVDVVDDYQKREFHTIGLRHQLSPPHLSVLITQSAMSVALSFGVKKSLFDEECRNSFRFSFPESMTSWVDIIPSIFKNENRLMVIREETLDRCISAHEANNLLIKKYIQLIQYYETCIRCEIERNEFEFDVKMLFLRSFIELKESEQYLVIKSDYDFVSMEREESLQTIDLINYNQTLQLNIEEEQSRNITSITSSENFILLSYCRCIVVEYWLYRFCCLRDLFITSTTVLVTEREHIDREQLCRYSISQLHQYEWNVLFQECDRSILNLNIQRVENFFRNIVDQESNCAFESIPRESLCDLMNLFYDCVREEVLVNHKIDNLIPLYRDNLYYECIVAVEELEWIIRLCNTEAFEIGVGIINDVVTMPGKVFEGKSIIQIEEINERELMNREFISQSSHLIAAQRDSLLCLQFVQCADRLFLVQLFTSDSEQLWRYRHQIEETHSRDLISEKSNIFRMTIPLCKTEKMTRLGLELDETITVVDLNIVSEEEEFHYVEMQVRKSQNRLAVPLLQSRSEEEFKLKKDFIEMSGTSIFNHINKLHRQMLSDINLSIKALVVWSTLSPLLSQKQHEIEFNYQNQFNIMSFQFIVELDSCIRNDLCQRSDCFFYSIEMLPVVEKCHHNTIAEHIVNAEIVFRNEMVEFECLEMDDLFICNQSEIQIIILFNCFKKQYFELINLETHERLNISVQRLAVTETLNRFFLFFDCDCQLSGLRITITESHFRTKINLRSIIGKLNIGFKNKMVTAKSVLLEANNLNVAVVAAGILFKKYHENEIKNRFFTLFSEMDEVENLNREFMVKMCDDEWNVLRRSFRIQSDIKKIIFFEIDVRSSNYRSALYTSEHINRNSIIHEREIDFGNTMKFIVCIFDIFKRIRLCGMFLSSDIVMKLSNTLVHAVLSNYSFIILNFDVCMLKLQSVVELLFLITKRILDDLFGIHNVKDLIVSFINFILKNGIKDISVGDAEMIYNVGIDVEIVIVILNFFNSMNCLVNSEVKQHCENFNCYIPIDVNNFLIPSISSSSSVIIDTAIFILLNDIQISLLTTNSFREINLLFECEDVIFNNQMKSFIIQTTSVNLINHYYFIGVGEFQFYFISSEQLCRNLIFDIENDQRDEIITQNFEIVIFLSEFDILKKYFDIENDLLKRHLEGVVDIVSDHFIKFQSCDLTDQLHSNLNPCSLIVIEQLFRQRCQENILNDVVELYGCFLIKEFELKNNESMCQYMFESVSCRQMIIVNGDEELRYFKIRGSFVENYYVIVMEEMGRFHELFLFEIDEYFQRILLSSTLVLTTLRECCESQREILFNEYSVGVFNLFYFHKLSIKCCENRESVLFEEQTNSFELFHSMVADGLMIKSTTDSFMIFSNEFERLKKLQIIATSASTLVSYFHDFCVFQRSCISNNFNSVLLFLKECFFRDQIKLSLQKNTSSIAALFYIELKKIVCEKNYETEINKLEIDQNESRNRCAVTSSRDENFLKIKTGWFVEHQECYFNELFSDYLNLIFISTESLDRSFITESYYSDIVAIADTNFTSLRDTISKESFISFSEVCIFDCCHTTFLMNQTESTLSMNELYGEILMYRFIEEGNLFYKTTLFKNTDCQEDITRLYLKTDENQERAHILDMFLIDDVVSCFEITFASELFSLTETAELYGRFGLVCDEMLSLKNEYSSLVVGDGGVKNIKTITQSKRYANFSLEIKTFEESWERLMLVDQYFGCVRVEISLLEKSIRRDIEDSLIDITETHQIQKTKLTNAIVVNNIFKENSNRLVFEYNDLWHQFIKIHTKGLFSLLVPYEESNRHIQTTAQLVELHSLLTWRELIEVTDIKKTYVIELEIFNRGGVVSLEDERRDEIMIWGVGKLIENQILPTSTPTSPSVMSSNVNTEGITSSAETIQSLATSDVEILQSDFRLSIGAVEHKSFSTLKESFQEELSDIIIILVGVVQENESEDRFKIKKEQYTSRKDLCTEITQIFNQLLKSKKGMR